MAQVPDGAGKSRGPSSSLPPSPHLHQCAVMWVRCLWAVGLGPRLSRWEGSGRWKSKRETVPSPESQARRQTSLSLGVPSPELGPRGSGCLPFPAEPEARVPTPQGLGERPLHRAPVAHRGRPPELARDQGHDGGRVAPHHDQARRARELPATALRGRPAAPRCARAAPGVTGLGEGPHWVPVPHCGSLFLGLGLSLRGPGVVGALAEL